MPPLNNDIQKARSTPAGGSPDSSAEEFRAKKPKYNLIYVLIFIFFLGVLYYVISPPVRTNNVTIHISSLDTLSEIAIQLEEKKVIRFPFILKTLVSLISSDKRIERGDYKFIKGENLIGVAIQLARSRHGVDRIKITFREGLTNIQMADILAGKLSSFRRDLFLSDVRAKQGYLFPDTYFYYPMSTTDEILDDLTSNFKKKIESVDKDISISGKSLSDIIIMASIIEKEAYGKSDAGIISGILWKRIKLGMLLQVDASLVTYKIVGLPNTPIANPGISSILSAIKPIDSPYLFYLHADTGRVHYAVDFSEHRSNIAKYLR